MSARQRVASAIRWAAWALAEILENAEGRYRTAGRRRVLVVSGHVAGCGCMDDEDEVCASLHNVDECRCPCHRSGAAP